MWMSRTSCRECYFIKVSCKNIDSLVERVKPAVMKMCVASEYDINVYKNVYACCGVGGIGVIIEVTGPEEKIRAVDLKAVSKVVEICEKEGLEHHTLGALEII